MWQVPSVGHSLTLDFVNPLIDVHNIDAVKTTLSDILAKLNIEVLHTILVNDSIHFIFQKGSLNATVFVDKSVLTIDLRLFDTEEDVYRYEESFAEVFGWNSNTGNAAYPRGGTKYHLLNKYYHSETMYKNIDLIHREKTKFQDLRIYNSKELGKVLSLDYMIQNSDSLEIDSYTIDLTSLVLRSKDEYPNILLIGAGDMIIPNYILSNFNVKRLTMVEIDDRVIENTKKYFKFYEEVDKFIQSGRLEVIVDDGAKYLRDQQHLGQIYDGIIIDNSDVYLFDGPAANLFTKDFYKNIHSSLKTGAFFSQQVSDEQVKAKWTEMVNSVGFITLDFKYAQTPEYSTALPLGSARRD